MAGAVTVAQSPSQLGVGNVHVSYVGVRFISARECQLCEYVLALLHGGTWVRARGDLTKHYHLAKHYGLTKYYDLTKYYGLP